MIIIYHGIAECPVVDTLASSYTPKTSMTPCGAAEAVATRKRATYAEITQSHLFVPIAIETLEPIYMDGLHLIDHCWLDYDLTTLTPYWLARHSKTSTGCNTSRTHWRGLS